MYKIRKVKFIDHPILKNLELDFCGKDGKAVDTVIIAGENGCGKSSVLNTLYGIASYITQTPVNIEIEKEQEIFTIEYYAKVIFLTIREIQNPIRRAVYIASMTEKKLRFRMCLKVSGLQKAVPNTMNSFLLQAF